MENSRNSLNFAEFRNSLNSQIKNHDTSAKEKSQRMNSTYTKRFKESKKITFSKILSQMQDSFEKILNRGETFDKEDLLGFGSILVMISIIFILITLLNYIA
tara:strand:+ start:1569 stop:1874 length:306 start_codon:yes stop_codon:yes gene_type:complete